MSDRTPRNWLARAKSESKGGLTKDERSELARLRRENRTLRMEREKLEKAAVFFAKER